MTDQNSNRLIKEKSPYLLQHAQNPVDWYPWCDEAFAKARQEHKPVFLSIGYSTCHWCHVMEKESFESEQIAKVLNESFIAIKVDREERPDIDQIYMSVVTAMTGQGGWPLSVFLSADRKPFYGGTYFPPEPRWGTVGFHDLLVSIRDNWQHQSEKMQTAGDGIIEALTKESQSAAGHPDDNPFDENISNQAFKVLASAFDKEHGGFGQAPKFPMGHTLGFLLRYARRTKNDQALEYVEATLSAMAAGGIYDHLGGGFHRYSTDPYWQVPHFEKMLYDQALLTKVYLEGYQLTGHQEYARVAAETMEYVLRDLRGDQGGFASAEDADSLSPTSDGDEKKEGAFYVWGLEEIKEIVGEDAGLLTLVYGLEKFGNAVQDPHGEFMGVNILHTVCSLEEAVEKSGIPKDVLIVKITIAKQKLLQARGLRPRPHRDDKVLTDWNGLMIGSLAFGAAVLDEPRYLQAAQDAADFILEKLKDSSGHLLHRYCDREAAIPAMLDDYAFLSEGLLHLYEAGGQTKYLKAACELGEEMIERFGQSQGGGLYLTDEEINGLIYRPRTYYDGAVPSGNSMAAALCLRLFDATGDEAFFQKGQDIIMGALPQVRQRPDAFCHMLSVIEYKLGNPLQIVVAGGDGDFQDEFSGAVFEYFLPSKVLIYAEHKDVEGHPAAPLMKGKNTPKGQPMGYLCQKQTCQAPVNDFEAWSKALEEHSTGDWDAA